jgi:hypothetical protein
LTLHAVTLEVARGAGTASTRAVVFGATHFQRKQLFSNYDMTSPIAQTIVSLLESGPQAITVLTVYTTAALVKVQPDVASWRPPGFVLLRGTMLGREDFTKFYETSCAAPPLRMEDQFDARETRVRDSVSSRSRLSSSLISGILTGI